MTTHTPRNSTPCASFQGLILPAHPTSGTDDDDDDRDDEHAGENEAPVRGRSTRAPKTPEEFEVDDKDKLGHAEDDDADEEEDEEEVAAPER